MTERSAEKFLEAFTRIVLPVGLAQFVVETLMAASSLRASPEKLTLGLAVGDEEGDRLGLVHAAGRAFVKNILMGFFPVEGLVAMVTPQDQALHDILSVTTVISR